MRYFQTSNASRQYKTGGLAFSFEPVDQIGGSWLGVLAAEESAASILAAGQFPQVKEITLEEYDAQKKKPLTRSSALIEQRGQLVSLPLQPRQNAEPAGSTEPPAPTQSAAGKSVTLKTKKLEVPDELKLETGAKSVRNRK